MKSIIVSDLHFGYANNSQEIAKGIVDFFTNQVIPYGKKHNITEMVIAGDVFEQRQMINVLTMKTAFDTITELAKQFKIEILVGNHDLYFKNSSDVDSLILFQNIPNVRVIRKPEVCETRSAVFIPWVVDEEAFKSEIKSYKVKHCIGHFDIPGFNLNTSTISDFGFDVKLFKSFDTVVTGHYHMRNEKDVGDTRFVYCGSPYQLNRGDLGTDRGFMVFDWDSGEYEFVNNEVSPRFTRLEFPNKFNPNDVKNNFVDIVVQCENNTYNEKKLESFITAVESCKPVVPPKIQIRSENVGTSVDFDVELADMSTTSKLLSEFVNVQFGDMSDKDYLLSKIMDIHSKVSNS